MSDILNILQCPHCMHKLGNLYRTSDNAAICVSCKYAWKLLAQDEVLVLRARLQTAEQQLNHIWREFEAMKTRAESAEQSLERVRRLAAEDSMAEQAKRVAAEQQLGQVREEVKRLTDALESSHMGRAVVHWMRAYDSIKASDDNDENCQILRIPKSMIPKGANLVEAYETAKQFVIIGTPESDDESHNCDAMGCSTLSHVVARVNKSPATPSDGCGKGRMDKESGVCSTCLAEVEFCQCVLLPEATIDLKTGKLIEEAASSSGEEGGR